MHPQSKPIAVNPTAPNRAAGVDPGTDWAGYRAAVASQEDAWAAYRAEAGGVHLVGVHLPFDDVFRLVLAVLLAQLLLVGIVAGFAALLWAAFVR